MSRSQVMWLLFIVLLVSLWYAWKETPRQQRVIAGNPVTQREVVPLDGKSAPSVSASLDFSGGGKVPFSKPKRDIFRALYRAPLVTEPVAPPAQPAPVVVEPLSPQPVISRPVVRVPTASRPIPPLSVLGFLRKGPNMTVFLASQQGDIYLVKKGDRFADGLLVRELSEKNITISRGQNDTGVTLLLGEQKAQRVPLPNRSVRRPREPFYPVPGAKAAKPAGHVGRNE
ncbi:MAG: hypothetical protein GXP51_08055 [Deltaproteobacteria bacterium]|nr:hypothetical protein [Deltaproteobacteria bacterium]